MIKYRFGAFDDLNDSLAILVSKGLIKQVAVGNQGWVKNFQYYISPLAYNLTKEISTQFPILLWYEDRAKVVASLAVGLGGTELKKIQYQHLDYAQAKLGTLIPSVKGEVLSKLKTLLEHHG
jgi:hypothetical protein